MFKMFCAVVRALCGGQGRSYLFGFWMTYL